MFIRTILLLGIAQMSDIVVARFCEGGHICTLPRECCTQGCCPPYQSIPRQLPPPSEHVLNLFFISHWFFWCVVVAIILAILCAYSLWKKRRTLCGWGFQEHRAQSEGDSAGSCYAPPQYSRCSSFHHPPPPYTEVTSKPDLYPLVFTCNSENGKTGSSYLMVQYFRNYIVRPAAGSLSAASTVDSLSSSFICNINEANTLVPPTYSRAASPELGFTTSFQHHYMLPRSASQLVCANNSNHANNGSPQTLYNQQRASHYNAVLLTGAVGGEESAVIVAPYHSRHGQFNRADSGTFEPDASSDSKQSVISIDDNNEIICHQRPDGFTQSQSDQHFRYVINSNSSVSDIFVNGSNCTGTAGNASCGVGDRTAQEARSTEAMAVTPAVIFNNNGAMKLNPLQRTSTNPTQFVVEPKLEAVYNSCNSIGGGGGGGGNSITLPVNKANSIETEFADVRALRHSLETCCKYLQQQQQTHEIPTRAGMTVGDSPLRNGEFIKKYTEEGLRSYLTSGTCSGVSSLANIGTPSSPPQATSPTCEVKEILEQIRQLQEGANYEDLMLGSTTTRPVLHHTMSTPSTQQQQQQNKRHSADNSLQLQRFATMPEQQNPAYVSPVTNSPPAHKMQSLQKSSNNLNKMSTTTTTTSSKRPVTLQQNKKKFHSPKPNRTMYIPMTASSSSSSNTAISSRCILKSPVGSMVGSVGFFANRGRVRKGWISRSAPTTPGTCLPPNFGDDSPLLNEHEEDQEGEQNAEME